MLKINAKKKILINKIKLRKSFINRSVQYALNNPKSDCNKGNNNQYLLINRIL